MPKQGLKHKLGQFAGALKGMVVSDKSDAKSGLKALGRAAKKDAVKSGKSGYISPKSDPDMTFSDLSAQEQKLINEAKEDFTGERQERIVNRIFDDAAKKQQRQKAQEATEAFNNIKGRGSQSLKSYEHTGSGRSKEEIQQSLNQVRNDRIASENANFASENPDLVGEDPTPNVVGSAGEYEGSINMTNVNEMVNKNLNKVQKMQIQKKGPMKYQQGDIEMELYSDSGKIKARQVQTSRNLEGTSQTIKSNAGNDNVGGNSGTVNSSSDEVVQDSKQTDNFFSGIYDFYAQGAKAGAKAIGNESDMTFSEAGSTISSSFGDLSTGQKLGVGYTGIAGANVGRRLVNNQDGLIRDRYGNINNAFTPGNPFF